MLILNHGNTLNLCGYRGEHVFLSILPLFDGLVMSSTDSGNDLIAELPLITENEKVFIFVISGSRDPLSWR